MFAAIDTYVVVLALPDMMRVGRHQPPDELQRAAPIISGFLLGYVAVLPLVGRIADLRGPVPVLAGVAGRRSPRLGGHHGLLRPRLAGRRPVPPGRRGWRPGAGDDGAGRRALPRGASRPAARAGLGRPGARLRPRPALRRRGAGLHELAGHLRDQRRGRRPAWVVVRAARPLGPRRRAAAGAAFPRPAGRAGSPRRSPWPRSPRSSSPSSPVRSVQQDLTYGELYVPLTEGGGRWVTPVGLVGDRGVGRPGGAGRTRSPLRRRRRRTPGLR